VFGLQAWLSLSPREWTVEEVDPVRSEKGVIDCHRSCVGKKEQPGFPAKEKMAIPLENALKEGKRSVKESLMLYF
jgi:hypothetical protein